MSNGKCAGADGPASPPAAGLEPAWRIVGTALLTYYCTSAVVFLGVVYGCMARIGQFDGAPSVQKVLGSCARWDGMYYQQIATEGYEYGPEHLSRVAFFPAYPLLARALGRLTGLEAPVAMLVVSQLALVFTLILAGFYVRGRYPGESAAAADSVILSLGLYPVTFFFRMGYSESLFLLVTLLALYGMLREWPLPVLAGIVGLATACRPVGVALLLPLTYELWTRAQTARAFAVSLLYVPALACWGLASYVVYLAAAFGAPLAFATTQSNYVLNRVPSWPAQVGAWLSLKPLWSLFDSSSPCYWAARGHVGNPIFNDRLINLVFVLLAFGLLCVGVRKRWLCAREWLLAAGLLVIPYLTRASETCLESSARFTAVILPLYLVLGRIFARVPQSLAACCAVVSAGLLALYSAMFAGWPRMP